MSATQFVDEAGQYARLLVEREARGPGDVENAMRRLEQRYGISFQDLWRLRYRAPKAIYAHVYERLKQAVEAQRNEQIRRLQHEIAITEALAGASNSAVAASKAALGEDSRPVSPAPRTSLPHEGGGPAETG